MTPREQLAAVRADLKRLAPVEAALVTRATVELLFSATTGGRPSAQQAQGWILDHLDEEDRAALDAAMGSERWLAVLAEIVERRRDEAVLQLVHESVLQCLKPAGYLPEDWFGADGARLTRMLRLIAGLLDILVDLPPGTAGIFLAHVSRDAQRRSLTASFPLPCPTCQREGRAGRRGQLGTIELSTAGPLFIHYPATAPSSEALQRKFDLDLPPSGGLQEPLIWRLASSADERRTFICGHHGHKIQLERDRLARLARRRLGSSLPDRFLGT